MDKLVKIVEYVNEIRPEILKNRLEELDITVMLKRDSVYGAALGISVFVLEKDKERALEILEETNKLYSDALEVTEMECLYDEIIMEHFDNDMI
jgi:hypothetical protein